MIYCHDIQIFITAMHPTILYELTESIETPPPAYQQFLIDLFQVQLDSQIKIFVFCFVI